MKGWRSGDDRDVLCVTCGAPAVGYSPCAMFRAGMDSVCPRHIRGGVVHTQREMDFETELHNLSNAVRLFSTGELDRTELFAHARKAHPFVWDNLPVGSAA